MCRLEIKIKKPIIIDRQAVYQLIINDEDEGKKFEVEDTVDVSSVGKKFE